MIPAENARPDAELVIEPLPAFTDNYLWLIQRGKRAVVVDPGDGEVVAKALAAKGLTLSAILVTHHHPDHIGGLSRLLREHAVPVYGPRAEAATIPQLTVRLDDGDAVELKDMGLRFAVLATPGHTLGHIVYYAEAKAATPPLLFCGDTLFAAGCGRLFEGSPAQMHASLSRLAPLPPATQVFCAHEYTLANLEFARAVEPDDGDLAEAVREVQALRAENRPSLPSSIERERRLNPFLRCAESSIRKAAEAQAGAAIDSAVECFAALRRWKDHHRPK